MVDSSGLFLILSNLAAIPAVVYAIYLWLLPEAAILGVAATISTMYHICQTGYGCIVRSTCPGTHSYSTMQSSDEFFVFTALIWFIMYFFQVRQNYRAATIFIAQAIIFLPVVVQFEVFIFLGSVAGAVALLACIAVVLFLRGRMFEFYMVGALVALVLLVVAFTLFVVAGEPGTEKYTYLHSTWHILVFFAAFFVIDIKHGITDATTADILYTIEPTAQGKFGKYP